MKADCLVQQLSSAKRFFEKTLSIFDEADSKFSPSAGLFSVCQHVEHTAQTIDWFVAGTFGEGGFDMDFARHDAETRAVTSLEQARKHLVAAFANAKEVVGSKSEAELDAMFPANDPIMPGVPRGTVVGGIMDHSAHHRGSLSVYARLIGKVPPMPYM